ncbi:hypothetical protein KAR91_52690 [Candidatus Pacearchaeota archaeon]|nr:hypothetical protein [Candidatus Pacearchaeota archaeon]
MISLSPIFTEANNQSEKQRDVLVMVEDETLFAEKSTEADWGNNASESNVDYTSSPPDAGDVILASHDSWAGLTAGATARYSHSAIEYNGKMYIFSGITGANDLWEYDITGDSWTQLTSGATHRTIHSAIEYNGKMYIYGGFGTSNYLNDLWEYDIAGDSWTQLTSGATIRGAHSAIEHDGKMYVFGGLDGFTNFDEVWEYDIVGNSWTQLTSGATARYSHSAIEYKGSMYIFGGNNGSSFFNEVWRYDTSSDSWTQLTSGATIRDTHSAVEHAGRMYIFGGYNGSSYLNDTWQYDISSDSWIQLTSGATVRSDHTAIDYLGKMYVFGGYSGSAALNTIYEYDLGYYSTGNITTDNIDIGEVPTVAGEWALEDIKPTGTTLTYTAEYSTTGAWGGEEVAIGAIIDGQAIANLIRYWRVTATLTTNTARDETPILQSIKADYTTYKRFNKTKDLGYEPLVDTVSSLTSKVDFFKPASIGKIGVSLVVTDSLSDWVYNDTLYNKIVRVKLGFNYPGFTQADYIDYFSGAIDDWDINDGILNLVLKDLSKEWKLPVPSKWEDTGDNRTWTNIHHTDIMLDVFQNDINVRDSGLLLDSFATVKADTPAYKATRTITGKTEDAKKLVEELRVLLFAFFLPRGDGKIGLKQFNSSDPIRTTFTDDNTLSIKWRANSKDLINRTSLYFDWDGVGDKEEDFAEYDGGPAVEPSTSQTKFQEVRPYILKDKWTDVAEASQISDLETKILAQFDDMPSSVTITCDAKDIAYEAGDMVGVTTLEAPGPMGAGITDEKYLLISKNLDFLGDKIVFEGLKVAT